MAGKRAKCRCGNAIQIPAAAQQMPAQQTPGQQMPAQQMPAQQVPGQMMPGQQVPAAPVQPQVPMAANSPFAGVEDDEMDDLFGQTPEAAAAAAAQAAAPEKKAIPLNLVGAGDDPDAKKKSDERPKLTGKKKALAILGITAGFIAEPYCGWIGWIYQGVLQSGGGEGYAAMLQTLGAAAVVLACVGLMSVAGALIAKGFADFRGREMDIGWVHSVGIILAGAFVGGMTLFQLVGVAQRVVDEDPEFVEVIKEVDENAGPDEKAETKANIKAIFGDALWGVFWVGLLAIIPIFVAVLSRQVNPSVKKTDDD